MQFVTVQQMIARDPKVRLPRRLAGFAMVLLTMVLASEAAANVSVSPAALYIDHRSPSASLTLYNTGSLPAEVEVTFAFGYPLADERGQVSVHLFESVPASEPSAVEWLRAFPRRLLLEPGQRQTIRVMVQPPANLPDGEYWGRVLVTSRGGQPPIEQTQGDVQVQISLETVVVTAVSFRKGPVASGLQVREPSVNVDSEVLELSVQLDRQGNAAFIGRFRAEVVGPDGRVVGTSEENIAVYYAMRRRFYVPLSGPVPAGSTLRYTIDTERPDLPTGGPLPVQPITGSVPISS
jgi:hypothetical protein